MKVFSTLFSKFLLVIFVVFSMIITCKAQVGINGDGSTPSTNAMLDVKSTNKGILIPRINYNNKPSVNVEKGMLIFVTANGPFGNDCFYYFDGSNWLRVQNNQNSQTLALNNDTLKISNGNSIVIGNILNLIGYYKCNNQYTQLSSDGNNCGACGNVCSLPNATSQCVNNSCAVKSCNNGFGNCNNQQGDGCETNFYTDVNNCGSCGNVCSSNNNANGVCTQGICSVICNGGFSNCNNNPNDGCESDLSIDPNNCGACGIVCPSGKSCVLGVCM